MNQLFDNKWGNKETMGDAKSPNEFPTSSKKVKVR